MTDTHLQTQSATAVMLDELQLYGWRPSTDEPDPRPLPEPDAIRTAVADIFDALVSTLSDTRLEPDLDDLLWSSTNLFHRMATRISHDLDSNEQAQKRAQREQDGSEVRSVELETLIAEGITLIERRNAYEAMRDLAAELFETHLGQTWHPRAGSHVNRRTLTASLIDSRDHIAAKRRADIEPLLRQGTKIAFTGGLDCNDHTAIWEALDRVRTKHTDMVLVHGGAPRGAERIAAAWANNRCVTQIVFKPDWTRHGKSAPFKRNDRLLDTLPTDIDGSAIAPAIVESCPTRIFLPNERAFEPQIAETYRRFGLNDRQIEIVARSLPKRDYYCQSRRGNRLFSLGLGDVALGFTAASSKTDQAAISDVLTTHGRKGFAAAWLHHCGLDWAIELLGPDTVPAEPAPPQPDQKEPDNDPQS